MALSLLLFNFSKRQDSTAIPADSAGTAVSVTIKNETSLNQPVFLLSGTRPNFTYAKFDGAYYFIDDIRSVRNGLYELVCSLDVLGTYRSQIQATTAFVEYCTGGNPDLTDARVVPEGISPRGAQAAVALPFTDAGKFILSVVGKNGGQQFSMNRGLIDLILQDVEQWADTQVSPAADWLDVAKTWATQFMSQGSAVDCIRECKWVPFDVDNLDQGGGVGQISLGNYVTSHTAHWIGEIAHHEERSISIPFSRTGWRRLAPYSDLSIFLPYVGVVSLDNAIFSTADSIGIDLSMNLSSGDIAYALSAGGVWLGTYGASTAVTIPIGFSNISPQSVLNAISGAAISMSYGNIFGAVGAVTSAFQATNTSIGGIQGGAGAGMPKSAVISLVERDTSGAPGNMAAVQGLPHFNTARLGDLSGYVQTRGASVAGSIRGAMRERINSMLDSGIFME